MCICEINWGSLADWVSGLGALAAAIVALYLARRSERIRLRAHCNISTLFFPGSHKQEVIAVSATNIGTRTTVINNIGMRVGPRRNRRHAVIGFNADRWSAGIPHTLADGQSANWYIELDPDRTWIKDLSKSMVKTAADVDSLRFVIHTSHGQDHVVGPTDNLKEALLAEIASGR